MSLSPEPVAVNTPRRFYRGGRKILGFRDLPVPADFDEHRPEDWLGSTTRLFAEGGDGLSTLPDGRTLVAALERDPEAWLGSAHLAEYGPEPGLLVKLLDAAERLPVHTHPDRTFASRHLDCAHGKTEAWLVLDAEPGAQVWLGFREDVDLERLTTMVEAQDEGLLDSLNGFAVERGDAVLVPAGQPHAIGAGVFVVELQEPTDFSVMLEHARFDLDPHQSWLGLDRAVALTSVDRTHLGPTELARLRSRWDRTTQPITSVLPADADEFFVAEVLDGRGGPAHGTSGFSVLVVVDGEGRLATASGREMHLRAGETVVTPYSCGDLTLTGTATAIRCRPGKTATHSSGVSTRGATSENWRHDS